VLIFDYNVDILLGINLINVKAHSSAFWVITDDGLKKKAFKLDTPLPAQPVNCAIYNCLSHWPMLFSQTNGVAHPRHPP
jgi:hypothetical protein